MTLCQLVGSRVMSNGKCLKFFQYLLNFLGLLYLSVVVLKSMKLVGSKTLQNCSSARYVEDSFVVRVVFSHYINVYLIFWTFIAAMESVRLG